METGSELEHGGDPAMDNNRAGIGRTEAGHKAQQRALAGAVGSDDAHGLALSDPEGYVPQGDESLPRSPAQQKRQVVMRKGPLRVQGERFGYGIKFDDVHGSEIIVKANAQAAECDPSKNEHRERTQKQLGQQLRGRRLRVQDDGAERQHHSS